MVSSTAFGCQLGMLGQQGPLVGVIAQHLHRGGELVAGGVGAGHQQAAREHEQFVVGEAVAVVFGADQLGDQVVGEVVAPVGDHVVEVGVERLPGPQDVGRVVGDVPVEGLEDVVGPVREQLPVLAGGAEQRADDRDRVLAGDVGDHVAAARGGERVDQLGDHLDDRGAQPRGRPGGERLGHESAQPVVFGTVEADDQLD